MDSVQVLKDDDIRSQTTMPKMLSGTLYHHIWVLGPSGNVPAGLVVVLPRDKAWLVAKGHLRHGLVMSGYMLQQNFRNRDVYRPGEGPIFRPLSEDLVSTIHSLWYPQKVSFAGLPVRSFCHEASWHFDSCRWFQKLSDCKKLL